MSSVLIQPSFGTRAARENWAATVEKPVHFEEGRLGTALNTEELAALRDLHPLGRARFWGTHKGNDAKMAKLHTGDLVLFTGEKRVRAIGEVGAVLRNAAAGDALWSPDPRRGSYRNVYSLRSFAHTDIPREEVWALPGFTYGDNFQGTRFVRPEFAEGVIEALGIKALTAAEAENAAEVALADELATELGRVVTGETVNVEQTAYERQAGTVLVQRAEALLVKAYVNFLGISDKRMRTPVGFTDLIVDTGRAGEVELVEAKSSLDRAKIREAIGQLLDYAPFCGSVVVLTVLLPARPDASAVDFANRCGIDIVFRIKGGGFLRLPATPTARSDTLRLIRPQP